MASINHQLVVDVSPETAWAKLRLVGEVHKLFDPVLVDSQLDGDTRIARFANGMVVHERVLDLDDERRRVSYTAIDVPGMTYHHASMQILDGGAGHCQFVWTTDFLPPQMGGQLRPLIEQGAKALKANLERGVATSSP